MGSEKSIGVSAYPGTAKNIDFRIFFKRKIVFAMQISNISKVRNGHVTQSKTLIFGAARLRKPGFMSDLTVKEDSPINLQQTRTHYKLFGTIVHFEFQRRLDFLGGGY